MTYTPTTWVDGTTPVNAANLNKIEAALVANDSALATPYVPLDSVVAAGTRVQANKLLAGDAQPAFRSLGSGKLEWGPGGATAPDTNLYRSGANALKTDGAIVASLGFYTVMASAANQAFSAQIAGDTNGYRMAVFADGKITWGPGGTSATDTNLYRQSAGQLQTDSALQIFRAAGSNAALYVSFTGNAFPRFQMNADGGMSWGTGAGGYDTALTRINPGVLKVNLGLVTQTQAPFVPGLKIDGGAGPHAIHVMKTSGDSQPVFLMENNGTIYWGPGGSTGTDNYIQRLSANLLRCGGAFRAAGDISANVDTAGGWTTNTVAVGHNGAGPSPCLFFSGHTKLFCPAPQQIEVDGVFRAGGIQCKSGISGAYSSSSYQFMWTGNVECWIDATFVGNLTLSSDARYKHSVAPLASTWETVKQLVPVSYRWRDKGIFIDDGKDHVGFIAQDVQGAIPSAVSEVADAKGEEQPLSLNLIDIVSTLCKALQEAMTRIEALEAA